MELEEIKEFSIKGEEDYLNEVYDTEEIIDDDYAVTPSSGRDEAIFSLNDVDNKFKSFIIRDPLVVLVGSTATQGKGADIDLVMRDEDLPEILKDAIKFRLYRQMAGEFNIPYDKTPDYIHFHDEAFGPYTDYKNLYRLKVERIPDEEVHKMEACEIIEKSRSRVIGGIVSTDSIDMEGERLHPEFLKRLWQNIKSLNSEYLNLMWSHSSSQIGQILLNYNGYKSGLLDNKLYLIAKLRDDLELANDVWKGILDGEIHSFSIKVQLKRPVTNSAKRVCKNDKCWVELLDGNFIEVSLTKSPANEDCSKLEILSK